PACGSGKSITSSASGPPNSYTPTAFTPLNNPTHRPIIPRKLTQITDADNRNGSAQKHGREPH
ncbi:hypothetical protein, partial [Mycolicibacterium smegmatis]|uniref:hypothetical protein n=1 Tax=Mycolicibacterium smegmatis TaxID=1772 RepID=UPI001F41EE18